ncbi:MAG: transcription antitermination factor NusB, partial [Clostridiales bacterium]|nr:transcription antitermination factor NusB [Clostridiales bacterium]
AALQMVYESMLGGEGGPETLLGLIGFQEDDEADFEFIKSLTEGVALYQAELEHQISIRSKSRELERIPVLVRAILKIALFELNYLKDSPPSAIINEAVELAHRYGEEGDSRFINGLLGSFMRDNPQT